MLVCGLPHVPIQPLEFGRGQALAQNERWCCSGMMGGTQSMACNPPAQEQTSDVIRLFKLNLIVSHKMVKY
jgi:hypothetical protein